MTVPTYQIHYTCCYEYRCRRSCDVLTKRTVCKSGCITPQAYLCRNHKQIPKTRCHQSAVAGPQQHFQASGKQWHKSSPIKITIPRPIPTSCTGGNLTFRIRPPYSSKRKIRCHTCRPSRSPTNEMYSRQP